MQMDFSSNYSPLFLSLFGSFSSGVQVLMNDIYNSCICIADIREKLKATQLAPTIWNSATLVNGNECVLGRVNAKTAGWKAGEGPTGWPEEYPGSKTISLPHLQNSGPIKKNCWNAGKDHYQFKHAYHHQYSRHRVIHRLTQLKNAF
jgi:hypothetical protein